MNRKFIFLAIFFASACSSADQINTNEAASPESLIEITTQTALYTKGEIVESVKDMTSIGVYCAHTGAIEWSGTTEFEKLIDSRFYMSSDSSWTNDDGGEPWEYETLEDNYTFFSYSPHVSDAQGLTSRIVGGELVIDYIVPNNSIQQPDLMYAEPLKDISPQAVGRVPLVYSHTLACVSFGVASSVEATIAGIYINGVVGDGSLSWDYSTNAPVWSLGDISADPFVVEVDDYSIGTEESVQVNSERGYLMMIPQQLTNGAEVVLDLGSDGQRTLTIPAGSEWEAGARYHYVIKVNEDEDCDDDDVEADFVFDSDQLSNCYIINPTPDQDTFIQIPIEARINDFWKNYSGENSDKITSDTTTDDIYVDLVWHDFNTPFEFKYEVVYDDNLEMAVQFFISSEFQEGNFVFVVYEYELKSNTVTPSKAQLWSWHLWFTDYNPDAIAAANVSNIESGADKAYTLTGYEGAVHRYKDAGSASVWSGIYKDKFIMDRNIGERDKYTSDYCAGTVYYQFGRKDPFPGNYATYYSGDSQPSVRSDSGVAYYVSVEYCKDFIASSSSVISNWCGETPSRLGTYIWFDIAYPVSTYDVGKSIFDPSPLGWRVPVSDTWSSFNSTNGSSAISSVGKYNCYGYRDPFNAATPTKGGSAAYVWSANPEPKSADMGYYMLYSSSEVCSPKSLEMMYGLPVRAIQE